MNINMGGRNTARRNNTNLDLKLVTADKLRPKTVHLLYRRSIRLLLQFFVAYYGLCPILKSGKSVGYYTTQYSFKAIRFSDFSSVHVEYCNIEEKHP